MSYKIEQIEGVGEVYAAKLAEAGIKTTEDLLGKCATPKERQEVADATGISPKCQFPRFFPENFRFQLIKSEFTERITNCDPFTILKHSTSTPFHRTRGCYAFNDSPTELINRINGII